MQAGDIILKVDNIECSTLGIRDIENIVYGTAKVLDLLVWKNPEDMVKLIKRADTVFETHTETYSEESQKNTINSEKELKSSEKFDFKYPHQFLDTNKSQKQPEHETMSTQSIAPISRKNKFENIEERIVEETARAFNERKCTKRVSRVSGQNGIKPHKTEDKLENNVVYNNVKGINPASLTYVITNSEEIDRAQNNFCSEPKTFCLPKSYQTEDHFIQNSKENNKLSKTSGFSKERWGNTLTNTSYKELPLQGSQVTEYESLSSNKNFEIDFKPLANSTLLRRPSDRDFSTKKIERKKTKEDEDDIDAQFTKYYQSMIDSKQETHKAEKPALPTPTAVTVKEIPPITKSNASLFNRNYQSKLEERKRISKSSERVINEAKKEINELVKSDYTNAEWSGKTEIYTSHKNDPNNFEFIDEDEDEPYNELEKNPMFNRLKTIEAQIERCMTPERLERESQFNQKFEEYYKATVSRSNLMNSRWNSQGKQHSEENLHTMKTKPRIPKPNVRLTDPKGVFFKRRYEECVLNSKNTTEEKHIPGFSSGFNNSKKFWKEMEKNIPGNTSEYRTHFMKLKNQFGEKQSSVVKQESKVPSPSKFVTDPEPKCFSPYENVVENDVNRREAHPIEVQEPPVVSKHIEYDRSKTPVGFYENKKPQLKVEIPKKSYEKIQTFGQTKSENRKLRSPVAENIEKIIASNSTSRRNSKTSNTPPLSEQLQNDVKDSSEFTFRAITPTSASSQVVDTRSSGGFTPTSPFYHDNLKASPVFVGLKVKVADSGDSKRCSICGEEPDCEEFQDNVDGQGVSIVQSVSEDVQPVRNQSGESPREQIRCCGGRAYCDE